MGIFAGIGTAVAGALFGGSALAATVISTGLAVGSQILLSQFRGSGEQPSRVYTAFQDTVAVGARQPAWVTYGRCVVKGHRVFYAKWGEGDKFNAGVFRLSHGHLDGLVEQVVFYGEVHDLVEQTPRGNEAKRYFVHGFDDHIELRFYDGRPGQGHDQRLVDVTTNTSRPWRASATGEGIAYVIVELKYDQELFEKGRPEFDFITKGVRQYDPREDSTVPGGDGPQRAGDPTSWGPATENPAIHRVNYLLGLRGRRSGRVLVGYGREPSQIDMASHMVAANICDRERTVSGGIVATYACSLRVEAPDDHIEVLRQFEDAMAGYPLNVNGLAGVVAGAPQVPVLNLTRADIRTDAPHDFRPAYPSSQSINVLRGQYTEPASLYRPESLSTVSVNADITADGGETQDEHSFLQVLDRDIGQYLLSIRYRQGRYQKKWVLPVSRRVGFQVDDGDQITFEGDTYWVSVEIGPRLTFTFTLTQTSNDIFDESGIEPGPVVVPRPPPENPSVLRAVAGFDVNAGFINGPGEPSPPMVEFTWTPPGDPTIDEVVIYHRPQGDTSDGYQSISKDPESGVFRTLANVEPDTVYEARATIRTTPTRFVRFTDWKTTLVATAPQDITVQLQNLGDDAYGALQDLRADMDRFFNRQELLAGNVAIDAADEFVRREIVEKRTENTRARIIQEAQIRADEDNALGQLITAVEALAGDATAQALFKITAQAGSGDVVVRFSLQLRASQGDTYKDSGMFLDIVTDGGDPPTFTARAMFAVDQFIVFDPDSGSQAKPLSFENGGLTAAFARFKESVTELSRSPNNKLRWGELAPGIDGVEIST